MPARFFVVTARKSNTDGKEWVISSYYKSLEEIEERKV